MSSPLSTWRALVEYRPGHQDLATLGQRHHSGARIDLNTKQVFGLSALIVLRNDHFADMNADSIQCAGAALYGQATQADLRQQGKPDCIRGCGKNQEERISC